MPAPAWKANGAVVTGSSGQLTPAWPTHVAGDVALLLIESAGWPLNVPTRNGFREIPWSPQRSGEITGNRSCISVYWARANSAAMAAPVIDVPATHDAKAMIVTFSGVGSIGVPWTVGKGRHVAGGTGVTWESITTPEADNLILNIFSHQGSGRSVSGVANAALSGVTERVDEGAGTGGLYLSTGTKTVAGATGGTTATLNVGDFQCQIVLALSPNSQVEDKAPTRGLVGTIVEAGASTNVAPAWPAHVAGDIGILIVEGGSAPGLTTPQGFAQVPNSPQASPGTAGNTTHLGVYWCRATSAAMASPTVTGTLDHVRAVILTIKDAVSSGDPIHATAGSVTAGATATATIPSLNTTKPNTLILGIVTSSFDQFSKAWIEGWANVNLEGITEWVDDSSVIGSGGAIFAGAGRLKDVGSTGAITATIDAITEQSRIMLAIEGQAAKVFGMDTGTFVLSGQALNIRRSLRTALDAGAFTLTGNDMETLVHLNKLFGMEPGAFICSPNDMTFQKRLVNWSKESPVEGSWVKELPPS